MAKRTIRRRMRKNRTIRKVMRGCNRRRMKKGGATAPQGLMEVHQSSTASGTSNSVNAKLAEHAAGASNIASNTPGPLVVANRQSNMAGGISTNAANAKGMQGGARTRHHRRRLRYKKSMARKSRRA